MKGRDLLLASCIVFFLIAFFLGFFLVRFDNSLMMVATSNAFVFAIAIPSFLGAVRWLGWRRGFLLLVTMGLLTLAIEGLAIVTGFPYGEFSYSSNLGPRLLGLVPFIVPFTYLPLLLGAVTLAWRRAGDCLPVRIIASTLLLLLIDLVLDPALVHAGMWTYSQPGAYFGVPLSNFIGWIFTGALYSALVHGISTLGGRSNPLPPFLMVVSLLLDLCLWSGYLFREMLIVPAVLGLVLATGTGYLLFTGNEEQL